MMKLVPKSHEQSNITYRFWEYPTARDFYFIGVDIAGEDDTGANSVARVWRDRPFKLVAEAVGNAKEEIWAKEIHKLGWYYSGTVLRNGNPEPYPAWIAIEIFSYGGTVLSILLNGRDIKKDLGVDDNTLTNSEIYRIKPYPHIYKMPDSDNLRNNIHRPGKTFGWWSGGGDSRFKRSGVLFPAGREIFELANDTPGVLPDANGIMEYMATKQYEGRPDPAPGDRIDRVVADCLARLCKKQGLCDGLYPKDTIPKKHNLDFWVEDDKIMFNPLGQPYRSRKKQRWFK